MTTAATFPHGEQVESLGLELDFLARIDGNPIRGPSKALVRDKARNLLLRTASLTRDFKMLWEELKKLAYATSPEILHAQRDHLLENYRLKLAMFQQGMRAAGWVADRTGERLPEADLLAPALTELEAFGNTLFGRWRTLDDLFAILVEEFPLSQEQLIEIAKANPPPQAWYDETDDPFSPAED